MKNEPLRICFLGTPDFAAFHLKSLIENPKFKIVGVVTQPDRPAGRKMQLTPSPVKVLAIENHLPVLTPESLRKELDVFAKIKLWNADIAVVVAFGQILQQEFLDHFRFGAVNVHGSLLPAWRGAAPIQRSIEAGDRITGISLQKMVKKLDAGDIIAEREITVDDKMTAIEMYDRMAVLGAQMLNEELLNYTTGKIKLKAQDESKVTYAAKIEKEESHLSGAHTARVLHNKVRALTMGPGTYFFLNEKRLKIHRTEVVVVSDSEEIEKIKKFKSDSVKAQDSTQPSGAARPVLVWQADDSGLVVISSFELKDNSLELLKITELQPESKPKMPVADFLKSHSLKKGDLLK